MPKPVWLEVIAKCHFEDGGKSYDFGDSVSPGVAMRFPNATGPRDLSTEDLQKLPPARLQEWLRWREEKPGQRKLQTRLIKGG